MAGDLAGVQNRDGKKTKKNKAGRNCHSFAWRLLRASSGTGLHSLLTKLEVCRATAQPGGGGFCMADTPSPLPFCNVGTPDAPSDVRLPPPILDGPSCRLCYCSRVMEDPRLFPRVLSKQEREPHFIALASFIFIFFYCIYFIAMPLLHGGVESPRDAIQMRLVGSAALGASSPALIYLSNLFPAYLVIQATLSGF